jgi:energy-coupling factor transporter ATP-binding protein EcfA2
VSGFQIKDSLEVQFSKAPCLSIAGPSGSGKTESAMRLMRGYCGPKDKFVIVDSEEKRALYKKARYQPWDWVDFQPPFTPERYVEVLEAVKHYKGVIVDSGSHEYSGPGGLQDIQEETLERMTRGNEARAEALTAPSWKDAKRRHKSKFMSYLIRYPTPLIICLRAEPKVKFVKVMKDGRERTEIVDAGYQPICEKMFMYEMLVGCMMTADNAGVPMHIKQLEKDLEPVFLSGKQIDEGTGERLAAWAADRQNAPIDIDALVSTLDVKTLPELETAFGVAWKKAKGDEPGRAKLKANYDTMKQAIQAGTI